MRSRGTNQESTSQHAPTRRSPITNCEKRTENAIRFPNRTTGTPRSLGQRFLAAQSRRRALRASGRGTASAGGGRVVSWSTLGRARRVPGPRGVETRHHVVHGCARTREQSRERRRRLGAGARAANRSRHAPSPLLPSRPSPRASRSLTAPFRRPSRPQHEAIDRRERLRRLALETIDLAKDPYFMRNHLGR